MNVKIVRLDNERIPKRIICDRSTGKRPKGERTEDERITLRHNKRSWYAVVSALNLRVY